RLAASAGPDSDFIGSVIGVEIVTALVACVLGVLFFKARRARKSIAYTTGRIETSVRPRRVWRVIKWIAVGAIPVAVIWMSVGVVALGRQNLLKQCNSDGISSCTTACDHGLKAACVRLGLLYEKGTEG